MVPYEYDKELARLGYVGHAAPLPLLSRLDQLREHNNAWDKLDCVWSKRVPKIPGPQKLSGNVLARVNASGRLVFTRFPSSSRSIGRKEWSVPLPGSQICVSGMDPSQDLFVLAESPRLSVLHALFSPRR